MQIFAGKTFSFFQNCDLELYGCGSNHFNQVGLPSRFTDEQGVKRHLTEIPLPVKIDAFDHVQLNQIFSGPNHSLALCFMGNRPVTLSWGSQRHAQLGLPTMAQNSTLPQLVHFFNDVYLGSAGCGGYHSAVVVGKQSFSEENRNFQLETSQRYLARLWNEI